MTGDWRTERGRSPVLKVAAALVLLGAVGWAIVHLERDRSQRLLDESVLKRLDADGTVYFAVMRGPEVTQEQWQSLRPHAAELRTLYLSHTTSVAGGLGPVARFSDLEQLILAGCGWVDDAELAKISGLSSLQRLDLSHTNVTDAGLRSLNLARIQQLDLTGCRGVTDAGIGVLREFEALRRVGLEGTSLTLDGFEQMRMAQPALLLQMKRPTMLKSLCRVINLTCWLETPEQADNLVRFLQLPHDWSTGLYSTSAAPTYVAVGGPAAGPALNQILASLPSIEFLSLRETTLAADIGAGAPRLETLELNEMEPPMELSGLLSLKSLENLRIYATKIPAGELRSLPQLPMLRRVDVAGSTISEEDLLAIAGCRSLRVVSLASMPVSDAVAEAVAALPELTHLTLYRTGISPEVLERIRAQYTHLQLRTE